MLGLHPGHFLTAFRSTITSSLIDESIPQAPLSFVYLFEDTEYFSATSVVPYVLLFFIKILTIPGKLGIDVFQELFHPRDRAVFREGYGFINLGFDSSLDFFNALWRYNLHLEQ